MSDENAWGRIDDLDKLRSMIWSQLARGAYSGRHDFHWPTLITVGAPYGPDGRTVVLQRADEETRQIVCHTDTRANKCAHIAEDTRVCWHFYDATHRVQVRIWADATIDTQGADVDAEFDNLSPKPRLIYTPHRTPGADLSAPGDAIPTRYRKTPDSADAEEAAREHFALVVSEAHTIECLMLRKGGHRRARFTHDEGGWSGSWIVP